MAESASANSGRIFISYRREETAYPAGWLFDRLHARFGGGQVFKDIDSIELGDDFVERITAAVASCDVLLALIGERWLSVTGDDGRRRLDDPDDFVRIEIEAALARKVRVIPVLVDGARMPQPDELPPSLAALARRQALELSPSRFDFDTSRLLKAVEATLAEIPAEPSPAAEPQHDDASGTRDVQRGRHGRLRISAAATVLAALLAVAWLLIGHEDSTVPGGKEASSSRISAALGHAIPAASRPCRRATRDEFYLRVDGAREQAICTAPKSRRLEGGALSYGLFSSPQKAHADVTGSYEWSLSPAAKNDRLKRCDRAAGNALRAVKRDLHLAAICGVYVAGENAGGLQIWWNESGSAVAGFLSFDRGTKPADGVDAWAKLVSDARKSSTHSSTQPTVARRSAGDADSARNGSTSAVGSNNAGSSQSSKSQSNASGSTNEQGADRSDACAQGYVWREAVAVDHVCVTPETRTQTADDNAQRDARIDPNGQYGPDSCVSGYVWREAVQGDHVCVTPATRAQAAADNAQAANRRAG